MIPPPIATPTPAAAMSPTPAASTAAVAVASPSPKRSAFAAIPRPSLKPGEVITWVKLDRPRLALGEIIAGSFALAGVVMLVSMLGGVILGHYRSKQKNTHGTRGLRLR